MKEVILHYRELIFDYLHANKETVFAHLAIITVAFLLYIASTPTPTVDMSVPDAAIKAATTEVAQEPPQLEEPKDDPFTLEELKQYDGKDADRPIYVAMKGIVFDVSSKREMYAPGAGYNIFAGKDASKGLGMSSLKPEDAVPDYSGLDEKELAVLDDWVKYYKKRYNIIGKVVDSPANKL